MRKVVLISRVHQAKNGEIGGSNIYYKLTPPLSSSLLVGTKFASKSVGCCFLFSARWTTKMNSSNVRVHKIPSSGVMFKSRVH